MWNQKRIQKLIRLAVLSVIEWRGLIQLVLFSKIVVAVDGSDSSNKVYDVGAQLAKLSNGKLIIVHVVLPPSPVVVAYFTLMPLASISYKLIWKNLERRLLQILF